MLVGSVRKVNNDKSGLSISLGEHELQQIDSTKYLGVTLDSSLNWNDHVLKLCSQISRKLSALRRSSKIANESLLNEMYNSNILPVMEYGCSVWGNWSVSHNNMIYRLQKRAARIVSGNYDFVNVSGDDLLSELKWTPFVERVR